MKTEGTSGLPQVKRRIFVNRTLNLRSIRAVGFDMDYTLIHYHSKEWERSAYNQLQQRLAERDLPVDDLVFDPDFVALGLILDLENGNIVKANRFGYVKRAYHGTRQLAFDALKDLYARELVNLAEKRWVFLNTLFALSEACMYAQLVDRLDSGQIGDVSGYEELYRLVKESLDETHMEGALKEEIMSDPGRFVELDPDLPLALLDLKHAGKKLLLITNSEWPYTRSMMAWAFEPYLPQGTNWQDLFDLVIVQARKPSFFTGQAPFFEVIDEAGRLQPVSGQLKNSATYLGGCAQAVENHFGLSGEQILYVGDHIFADVHVSKSLLRWRTALVVRALEDEIEAIEAFAGNQNLLTSLMAQKEEREHEQSRLRLQLQRINGAYGPEPGQKPGKIRNRMQDLRKELESLDARIGPLAKAYGELVNKRWGLLMRTGNDKSNLARQIERYADVYTSRVSNLLLVSPFAYLRSPHGSLPHHP